MKSPRRSKSTIEKLIKQHKVDECTAITMMLDEIERLRNVLQQEHEPHCRMLRENVRCSCAAHARRTAELLETLTLRGEVDRLSHLVDIHMAEIRRLDRDLGISRIALAKGTERSVQKLPVDEQSVDDHEKHS